LVVAVGVKSGFANELPVFGGEGDHVVEHAETDRLTAVAPTDVYGTKCPIS
jgi:hypothetical protein